jgi:CheY-like chemotaxis protein
MVTNFFQKKPRTGLLLEEFISHEHSAHVAHLLEKCFNHSSIIVDSYRINSSENAILIFIPIIINDNSTYTVFTIVSGIESNDQPALLSDVTRFTSHALRSPISNLLTLSDVRNHHMLGQLGDLKIEELLNSIYSQAIKLNEIVITLNAINKYREHQHTDEYALVNKNIKNIMLVDDDAIVNQIHKQILNLVLKDTTVKAFEYPADALAYIDNNLPDLILLDINMPKINGWLFLDMLTDKAVKTDVIMVSSSKDPDERNRALAYLSVKGFVSKPLTIDKVKIIFNIETL